MFNSKSRKVKELQALADKILAEQVTVNVRAPYFFHPDFIRVDTNSNYRTLKHLEKCGKLRFTFA